MLGHLVSNAMHDGPKVQAWDLSAWLRRLLALFKI
jgi:hypothetical protein